MFIKESFKNKLNIAVIWVMLIAACTVFWSLTLGGMIMLVSLH
ncbi:hypothetical protein [Serratia ureilytica]|nr:hypothetical protein [Serratia ureilytica]